MAQPGRPLIYASAERSSMISKPRDCRIDPGVLVQSLTIGIVRDEILGRRMPAQTRKVPMAARRTASNNESSTARSPGLEAVDRPST